MRNVCRKRSRGYARVERYVNEALTNGRDSTRHKQPLWTRAHRRSPWDRSRWWAVVDLVPGVRFQEAQQASPH